MELINDENDNIRGLDDIDIDDKTLSMKKYKQSIIRFNVVTHEIAEKEQQRQQKVKKKKDESNKENESANESANEIIGEMDDIGPTFELTIKEASLSPVLSTIPNLYDAEKYSHGQYFENIVNSRLVKIIDVPKPLCEIISQYCVTLPDIRKVNHDIMGLVVDYLKHHNGEMPNEISKPLRSVKMERIVDDRWDATFIDQMSKKTVFQVILTANYLGIDCLQHLGMVKIATLIKAKSPQEIKNILADVE